jgi:Flp pilus assembly protein TadD
MWTRAKIKRYSMRLATRPVIGTVRPLARWLSFRRGSTVITRADAAVRSGEFDLALKLYREAIDRNPHNAPIWIQCGHLLKQSGDFQAAEAAYRRAISFTPHLADQHVQLGHVLKLQGRLEEAERAYVQAMVLEPASQIAAGELVALGWSEDRRSQLQSLLANEVAPANSVAPSGSRTLRRRGFRSSIITRADRARDAKRWGRAARLYRTALRRKSTNAPIWVQYGHALKNLGKLKGAEVAYRQGLALDRNNADTRLQLGHLLKLRNEPRLAERLYLSALAINPQLGDALGELHHLGWSEKELAELQLTIGPN